MGLLVECIRETAAYPRPIRLTLTCDGHRRSLDIIGPMVQHFTHRDGFIAQYKMAMAAGWKDTYNKHGERIFLGPCCSGK